jgi:SsrA-binding protein
MSRAKGPGGRVVADNRKARRDYFIEDTLEAGIALLGSEVKSLRAGRATIAESYASERNGELILRNAHIAKYEAANRFGHEERRDRKLLLRRREIDKLAEAVKKAGMTLVPLKLYFNERGIAKLLLGLAKGKRQYDKRATEKERDWKRQKQRLMKEHG